ncbi:MAG TPA: YggS family pyridoxal phosphate-dependent enzyme [Candidatus Ozemobacteraceae bacterium]|nr:YggS family pyridoxal phosphate-dependent enzyme [Candidatus Ozemobacteraceae bacterium]
MDLVKNLELTRARIRAAAESCGRNPGDVKLVAVTKSVGIETIASLFQAGQDLMAESRPQALRDRANMLAGKPIRWHFIGPLQANKVKYVYPIAEMVHSIDREDLIEEFGIWAQKTGRKTPFLLEVHISPEPTKQGLDPKQVLKLIERLRNRPDLDIRGLMGMAPYVEDDDKIRSSFQLLSGLLKESRALEGPAYKAVELSMGMSDDYTIAIEEGATMVRIGTALFDDIADPSQEEA